MARTEDQDRAIAALVALCAMIAMPTARDDNEDEPWRKTIFELWPHLGPIPPACAEMFDAALAYAQDEVGQRDSRKLTNLKLIAYAYFRLAAASRIEAFREGLE